jgi:hydroxymethylpyrimidine/phosphomethylpyrimidine kinase
MSAAIANVLSIAGCDPSGGAGIAADLKTFAAFRVYGMAVITALTAQNTLGVSAIHYPPPAFLDQQLDVLMRDIRLDGIKIGMVGSAGAVEVIARHVRAQPQAHCVLDPVMVASSGDALSCGDVAEAVCHHLLSLCDVITPNGPEIAALTGLPMPRHRDEQEQAGRALLARGARAVLVKGGHSEEREAIDVLVEADSVRYFSAPRLVTRHTHGTGCTLSSAVAAGLAQGLNLGDAVARAKDFVHGAMAHADVLDVGAGTGHGPLDHNWRDRAEKRS